MSVLIQFKKKEKKIHCIPIKFQILWGGQFKSKFDIIHVPDVLKSGLGRGKCALGERNQM